MAKKSKKSAKKTAKKSSKKVAKKKVTKKVAKKTSKKNAKKVAKKVTKKVVAKKVTKPLAKREPRKRINTSAPVYKLSEHLNELPKTSFFETEQNEVLINPVLNQNSNHQPENNHTPNEIF